VTQELRVYNFLRLRVEFHGSNPINQKTHHHPQPSTVMRSLYEGMIVNFEQAEADAPARGDIFDEPALPGTYLIIYPTAAEEYLDPFIEWKRRKGHIVHLACTADIGGSYNQIKNYVQDAYDDWETPPEYLLMIGDSGGTYGVAAGDSYGDHPYSRLEGVDILADIVVGRFSVTTATQLQTVINKTIKYESDPHLIDPDWLESATVIAGSSISGISTIQTNQQVKQRLLQAGYTEVDTCFYDSGCNPPAMITSTMNEGISFLNYRGWIGMEGWSNELCNQLNNGWMMPLVTIPTCATGTWVGTNTTSFTEGFLRAGSPTLGKGGVAAVGLATAGTHTRYNNTICMGVYGGIFDWGLQAFGTAIFRGKYELYLSFPNNAGDVSNFCSWFNEMGDPGLEVRYGVPDQLQAAFPEIVTQGASFLPITVTTSAGTPATGALVTLYREEEIFERRLVDADGTALLPLPADCETGAVMVTASLFNTVPMLGECQISTGDAYPSVTGFEIDDSAGDNAGDVNPGETIAFPVTLANSGSTTTLTGLTLTATVAPQYGELTVSSQTAPDLAPGATGSTDGDFVIDVAATLTDGTLVPIQLQVNCDQGDFAGLIELPVMAPMLEMVEIQVVSGSLEPGAVAAIAVELLNNGSKTLTGGTGILLLSSPFLTVTDSLGAWNGIPPGDSGSNNFNTFTVEVDAITVVGYPITGTIEWESDSGIRGTTEVSGIVGNPGTDDPTGPDNYGYWAVENQDNGYTTAPVYEWLEIVDLPGAVEVGLNDHGVEQDDAERVPLPFNFVYYGVEFDSVTICSNGYIAFGYNTTWFNNGRNQPLPNPQGARNMVAPMWDDP